MRKFLIVDDNVALADNLAEIIADADAGEAITAQDGAQALALAQKTSFDVLVSDVRMPVMNGVELFRRVRLLDPTLPVILVTAYTANDELSAASEEGVLCVLPKPVPIAHLLSLLRDARRHGVVALVGSDSVLRDSLVVAMRAHGFATVSACSIAEGATLHGSPFAVVVDVRLIGDPNGDALERLAETFMPLPVLIVSGAPQTEQPASESGILMVPSDTARLMDALGGLCSEGQVRIPGSTA